MYKYCSHCGEKMEVSANFCIRCGTKFGEASFEDAGQAGFSQSEYEPGGEENYYSTSTAQPCQEVFSTSGIDKISTSFKVCNVELIASDTEDIQVTWEKTDSWNLISHMKGTTLYLKEHNRFGIHNIHDFFHNSGKNVVRIEVPRAKAFDLQLENETGAIVVSDVEANQYAELKTSIGKIELNNLKTRESLTVTTTTGSIRVSEISTGQVVRLGSQIGRIQAENITTESFFLNSTSGRCSIRNINTGGHLIVTGGVGELLLDEVSADKMDIRMNASGNINCQNLYAGSSISIYNTVGNVSCGICDDAANYTTHCHSEQGTNNYPEVSGKGSKNLNIRTTLGGVSICFTGIKS